MTATKANKTFKRIGTHDGRFHADDVIATAILKEIFEVELVRTRDEKVLSTLDIVYDVGGGKFDHHGIDKVYRPDGIPYAACGLIWKEYGEAVIRSKESGLKNEDTTKIFNYIDRNFIEGVDALDNGIWIDKSEIPLVNISSIISGFNPLWNSDKDENEAFDEAVQFSASVLRNMLNQRFSVLTSREHVVKAFNNRSVPEVLILDLYCPYAETLREIDERAEVIYVIYPNKNGYAIQTVRGANGEDKKLLPKEWAGLRNEELAAVTKVSDAVFCHTGRFIAVAKTLKGITKMAELALKNDDTDISKGLLYYVKKFLRLNSK